jgi:hypothetical protein
MIGSPTLTLTRPDLAKLLREIEARIETASPVERDTLERKRARVVEAYRLSIPPAIEHRAAA